MSDAQTTQPLARLCTAFSGHRRIASGTLVEVALAVWRASQDTAPMPLVFDDATGRIVEIDVRGSAADVIGRLTVTSEPAALPVARRGRPKLGVIPREVTLLPRHWDWLATQQGSASQVIRRLIDHARAAQAGAGGQQLDQDRAYRFIAAIAGDLPGFEAVSRALFAGDLPAMIAAAAEWPDDIRDYAVALATPGEN